MVVDCFWQDFIEVKDAFMFSYFIMFSYVVCMCIPYICILQWESWHFMVYPDLTPPKNKVLKKLLLKTGNNGSSYWIVKAQAQTIQKYFKATWRIEIALVANLVSLCGFWLIFIMNSDCNWIVYHVMQSMRWVRRFLQDSLLSLRQMCWSLGYMGDFFPKVDYLDGWMDGWIDGCVAR